MGDAETSGLIVAAGAPSRPYLVYTSAGDRAGLHRWLKGPRNFDLWITYYGEADDRFREVAQFYNRRPGSKFQNLHFAYTCWRDVFARYSAIMVMDDDVHISGGEISRLFELRERIDLWVLQPAFSPWGKISYAGTRVNRTTRLRYTNFVEVTCPLFRRDKLEAFLEVYDPILVGWGIDWWYLHTLGSNLDGRVAIVDEITCLNPHDAFKGGYREINRLQPLRQRIDVWKRIRMQYGVTNQDQGIVEYRRVFRPAFAQLVGRVVSPPERLAAWLVSTTARAVMKAVKMWRARTRGPSAQPG